MRGSPCDRAHLLVMRAHRAWACAACGRGADPRARRQVRPLGARACATARCCSPASCRRLAGCFISIGDIHTFTEGMTNGAGYLAIAAVIFGNWKIGRTRARVPAVRRGDGAAVPAAGVRHPCADRASDHAALPAGAGRGGGADRTQTAPPALDAAVPGGDAGRTEYHRRRPVRPAPHRLTIRFCPCYARRRQPRRPASPTRATRRPPGASNSQRKPAQDVEYRDPRVCGQGV